MGIGFSFIHYQEELLDAVSSGSSLSSSRSSLGDSTSVFSLQLIWGQAATQKTADLLPRFTRVHTGCWQTLSAALCVSFDLSLHLHPWPHPSVIMSAPLFISWVIVLISAAVWLQNNFQKRKKHPPPPPPSLIWSAVILYVWLFFTPLIASIGHGVWHISPGAAEL